MSPQQQHQIWVIDHEVNDATRERIGDARVVADKLAWSVGVLLVGHGFENVQSLISHGADTVCHAAVENAGPNTRVAVAARLLEEHRPRLVLAAGDGAGRQWAARLAVRGAWKLVSPALLVKVRDRTLEVTGLDRTGRLSRLVRAVDEETLIVTLRPGVGEALPADLGRVGEVRQMNVEPENETALLHQSIPADPAMIDIRHADRLVAGGRGLGGRCGFDGLRRLAARLRAGVAASRVAVDLGWIERDRQVGQTGKTVGPELYIACGISGASHHLGGMSKSRHIVAINTDREAPIFKHAHLGLVADLHEVLEHAEKRMADRC